MKQFKDVTVGVSISTLDDKISRILEPFASLPSKRLQVLKTCSDHGIKTYTFISPIFPFVSDVKRIIEKSLSYSDYYMFENLNIRPLNSHRVYSFYEDYFPGLLSMVQKAYSRNSTYWNSERAKWYAFCRKRAIRASFFFGHKDN